MNTPILAAWMQAESQGGSTFETILLLFGIVVFVVLAPRLIRMGRPRPCPAPESHPPADRHTPSSIRVRETVDRALVELVDTSRDISAQIDNRIRMLNKLVKDADEERKALENLLAEIRAEREAGMHAASMTRHPSDPRGECQGQRGAYPAVPGIPGNAGAAFAPETSTGDRGGTGGWGDTTAVCLDGAPNPGAEESLTGTDAVPRHVGASSGGSTSALTSASTSGSNLPHPEPTPAEVGSAMNQAYARIAVLAGEGRSPAEIARHMRLSTAEVNLVLHILECQKG